MIEIRNISASYTKGKRALDGISFSLQDGTLSSLVGPSGCGKTTMLKILAGFMQPDEGQILVDGRDITALPIQKRGTAMVFQNYALWPHMTIFENIAYGLRLQKRSREEIERRVEEILRVVEIAPSIVRERHPAELSGGQQQRIALARALVVEPKIILMDEPLSNLDAKVRQRLRIEIREIQQRLGVTAVYVTHDQEEAMSMSDQVVVMNNGVIAQFGTPQEVYSKPAGSFVAEFLGHSNLILGTVRGGEVYVGGQKVDLPHDLPDGQVKMIVRAETISLEAPREPDNVLRLQGEILGSMYVGTYYRHLVRVEGQELFVDSCVHQREKGAAVLYMPSKEVYAFPA